MCLTEKEVKKYYKLWCTLVWGVNEKQNIIPKFKLPVYSYNKAPDIAPFLELKDKIFENPHWIDEFIRDEAYGKLNLSELKMVQDWRAHFVKGRFIVIDHIEDKYSVFMPLDDPTKIYGVYGISDPLDKLMFMFPKPTLIEAELLPFDRRIIINSLFNTFGSEAFEEKFVDALVSEYNKIVCNTGIVVDMKKPPVVPNDVREYLLVTKNQMRRKKLENLFANIDMKRLPPGTKIENVCEEYTKKPYLVFLEGYSHELYDEIMTNICGWLDEFEESSEFRALSHGAKHATDFIVQNFAQYMYTFCRQQPDVWNVEALKEILCILFPRKVTADSVLFNFVEPVLYGLFTFLQKHGHINNANELTAALPAACMKMIRNAENEENWAPAKRMTMMGINNS